MNTYQFTDLYNFDESSGIVIPDTSNIKSRVEDMMRMIFGSNLDVTEETPMGRMIEMIVVLITQTLGVNAQNANQYNLNTASGIYLDSIGVLYGLPRRAATRTRVKCTVTGVEGTVIPTTAIASTEKGDNFSPENEITIGIDGTATGYFCAMETGVVPCDNRTLTTIVSGIIGWETVSNNTNVATEYGVDIESDVSYRKRLLYARAKGSSSVAAIARAIYNCDRNVKSCFVLENGHSQSIVKHGITIPPHSIYACVNGGADASIAKAIFETKTAGAGYTHNAGAADEKIISVIDDYTHANYDVVFFRPIETTIQFIVNVERNLYSGTSLTIDVANALISYITEIGIGGKITRDSAVAYLASALPTIKVLNLVFNQYGLDSQDELQFNGNAMPVTSGDNIFTLTT